MTSEESKGARRAIGLLTKLKYEMQVGALSLLMSPLLVLFTTVCLCVCSYDPFLLSSSLPNPRFIPLAPSLSSLFPPGKPDGQTNDTAYRRGL